MTQEMIIAEVILEFVFKGTLLIVGLAFLFGIFTRLMKALQKND